MQQEPTPWGRQPNPGQQPHAGQAPGQPYSGQPYPGQQPPGQYQPQQGQRPPFGPPAGGYPQGQGQHGHYQQAQYPNPGYQGQQHPNPGYQGQQYQQPGQPAGLPRHPQGGWSKRLIAIVTASCVVVAAAIVVIVVLLNRGPDTSSPQATAEAFVAAINDRDADAMADLVCANDREAAQKYQTGGATTDASGASVHATLQGVDQDGESATMTVSMTMTTSGSTAGTSVPVTLPMQHTDGQWLVCGITEAGSVPGGGTLPGGGSLPSNLPGGLPSTLPGGGSLPSNLPGGLPSNVPTAPPAAGHSAPDGTPTGGPGSGPDRTDANGVAHAWEDEVNAYDVDGINALMCREARISAAQVAQMQSAGMTVDVIDVDVSGAGAEMHVLFHNVPGSGGNDTEPDTLQMSADSAGSWSVCPD